jgi:hypothetical protein
MLPPGTGIRFDAPGPDWLRHPPERPFVDVFLYDIAEDTGGLTADGALVRSPVGQPLAWQPPVRRYRLSYLLTAWSADVPSDHELLGAVMAGCAATAVIPPDCLHGALLDAGLPVHVQCAPPREAAGAAPSATSAAGLCQALGVPPRAALTLAMVAPVLPAPSTDVAPPARSIDLGMTASAQAPPAPVAQPSAPSKPSSTSPSGRTTLRRWERTRITERPPA